MELPPPAAVAGRLVRTLAVRPYRALRPFLEEDATPADGVFGQLLGVAAGVLSFAFVTLGTLAAALGSVLYVIAFTLIRLPARLLAAVTSRR